MYYLFFYLSLKNNCEVITFLPSSLKYTYYISSVKMLLLYVTLDDALTNPFSYTIIL